MNTTADSQEIALNRPNEPHKYLERHPASSRNDEIGNRRYRQYLWTETAQRRNSRMERALEEIILFLIGFDHGYADAVSGCKTINRTVFNKTWRSFLAESHGYLILAGEPYPDTKPTTLRDAKLFFRDGYGYGVEWAQKESKLQQEHCNSVIANNADLGNVSFQPEKS